MEVNVLKNTKSPHIQGGLLPKSIILRLKEKKEDEDWWESEPRSRNQTRIRPGSDQDQTRILHGDIRGSQDPEGLQDSDWQTAAAEPSTHRGQEQKREEQWWMWRSPLTGTSGRRRRRGWGRTRGWKNNRNRCEAEVGSGPHGNRSTGGCDLQTGGVAPGTTSEVSLQNLQIHRNLTDRLHWNSRSTEPQWSVSPWDTRGWAPHSWTLRLWVTGPIAPLLLLRWSISWQEPESLPRGRFKTLWVAAAAFALDVEISLAVKTLGLVH